MTQDKKFTWAELKAAVNEIPDALLNQEVRIWGDERGFHSTSIFLLDEDYALTDEGYEPMSVIKENEEESQWSEYDDILPKGTPILEI